MILTVGEAAFVIAVGTQTVSRTQEQRACWVTGLARRTAYYHTSLSAAFMQHSYDLLQLPKCTVFTAVKTLSHNAMRFQRYNESISTTISFSHFSIFTNNFQQILFLTPYLNGLRKNKAFHTKLDVTY